MKRLEKKKSLVLGEGASGKVTALTDAEDEWVRKRTVIPYSVAGKKEYHAPGSEAIAEYYYSRFLDRLDPKAFVKPLYLIRGDSGDRYGCSGLNLYVLYLEKETLLTAKQIIDRNIQLDCDEQKLFMWRCLIQLRTLHEQNICHNDINLNNIFYSKEIIKIFDFGKASFAYAVGSPFGKSLCSIFNAPELHRKKTTLRITNPKAGDVFSLGICFLSLFNGLKPHMIRAQTLFAEGLQATDEQIKNMYQPEVDSYPFSFLTFVSKMVCLDPSARFSVTQLMEDSFFEIKSLGFNLFDKKHFNK